MPLLGVAMVIFLVSLAGIPPTAGFIGKIYIFTAVLQAGSQWIWLAVVGILNSVVSLFYYFRIARNMWVRGDNMPKETFKLSPLAIAVVLILVVPTVLFGLYFSPIVNWANASVSMLMPF